MKVEKYKLKLEMWRRTLDAKGFKLSRVNMEYLNMSRNERRLRWMILRLVKVEAFATYAL